MNPTDVMYFTVQVSETFDVPPETVQDAVRWEIDNLKRFSSTDL